MESVDAQVNQRLVGNKSPVPVRITPDSLRELARQLGVVASERYWELFRRAALTLRMSHESQRVSLAAARRQRSKRKGAAEAPEDKGQVSMSSIPTEKRCIRGLARQVLITAHLDPDGEIESVAPLREIMKYYELQVDELPGLTRRSAETYLRKVCSLDFHLSQEKDSELAGFLYANRGGGWVLINCDTKNPLTRRRFSIAHELGHYLLHFLQLLESPTVQFHKGEMAAEFWEGLSVPADEEAAEIVRSQGIATPSLFQEPLRLSAAELEAMETEADYFAAELLMPEPTIRRLTTRYDRLCGQSRETLSRRLATECFVSQAAMRRRLAELDLP